MSELLFIPAGLLGLFGSYMVTAGTWRYVWSNGDPMNVETAKNNILYGIVAGLLAGPAAGVLALAFTPSAAGWIGVGLAVSPVPMLLLNLGLLALFVTSVKARSAALQQIMLSAATIAAAPLSRDERADFIESTRAMLTHCRPRDRWSLMFNIVITSPKMATQRRRARNLSSQLSLTLLEPE